MHGDFGLLVNLSMSLVLALTLGLLSHRLRLSPIVGYLLAGIILGPQTPGFVADTKMAAELAEIGVVLLMFGVGMHFDLNDLLAVWKIAVPGAAGQIVVATLLSLVVTSVSGMEFSAGLVIGFAVSVASTVVVIRVLMDRDALHSPHGHIAVGWLIVQDIFTVLVLVAMPALASSMHTPAGAEHAADSNILVAVFSAVAKVIGLGLVVIVGGRLVIPWLLRQVARTRSRELFTLTILAIALAVSTGSAVLFGVSMALGAFLAGMVVGQTDMSHQAAADALPMRDAFAVLFFVSVGMLFDPTVLLEHPMVVLAILSIVMIANPLTAFVIVWVMRYSLRSAFTIAALLSQIGEFSFLLADEAMRYKILPPEGQSLLVACAIFSIALNPLFFYGIEPLEKLLRKMPRVWKFLNSRSEIGGAELNQATYERMDAETGKDVPAKRAVIIGYGPVGQTASRILKEFKVQPVIIDLNLDTIKDLTDRGEFGIYGDAAQPDILKVAGIKEARYLLVTIPAVLERTVVILTAKELNPSLRVFVRARYIRERAWLEEIGATEIVSEEAETAMGLAVLLLKEMGAEEEHIRHEIRRIEQDLQARSMVQLD